MPDKNERRAQREHAVDSLNTVARVLEIEPIPVRASAEEVTELYESLCEKGSAEHRERIAQARDKWMQNGGRELDAELLTSMGAEEGEEEEGADQEGEFPGGEESVRGHRRMHGTAQKAFRLRARAFMMTFNSSVPGHQSFL